jgi:hypothetical protein
VKRLLIACVSLLGAAASAAGEPKSLELPQIVKAAGPNSWVKLEKGSYGGRNSTAIVFLPKEARFLILGGSGSNKGRYSELTLNLKEGVWENRFPHGKEWGPLVGNAKAPGYRYGAPPFKDDAGNFRPNISYGYNHRMETWGCATYDPERKKVVIPFHVLKKTYEYDPEKRTWAHVASAEDAPWQFWDDIVFGATCYDPVNKEVLAGRCRWALKDGKWTERKFGSELINDLGKKAAGLHLEVRKLLGACRARFYMTESKQMAAAKPDAVARKLAKDLGEFAAELKSPSGKPSAYEKIQCERASASLAKAVTALEKASPVLGGKITPGIISDVEDSWEAVDDVLEDLAPAPPGRAYFGLACDPRRGKIVLFGGHRFDRLCADTWVYDCKTRTWEERRPRLSPPPRGSHGMVWLPTSGKIALVDGFGCKPGTWTYDIEKNEWKLLVEGAKRHGLTSYPSTWGWQPEPSAAGPGDVMVTLCNVHSSKLKVRFTTWVAKIDVTKVDEAGTRKQGVPPRTEKMAVGKKGEPKWYDRNAGTVGTAAQSEWIKSLPANQWVSRGQKSAGNRPHDNRAWGTTILDPDRDQILHWGGGHVAYCGNALLHYSLKANQYYIGHRPETALMYAHGQGGMKMSASYRGRGLMTGHAYHSYAYDPVSKKVAVCGQNPRVMVKGSHFYVYDPAATEWVPGPIDAPFMISYSGTILCSTPKGIVAWSGGLWKLDVDGRKWEKMPLSGARLIGGGPDQHGMVYDWKRDRLLLFSSRAKGQVTAYDMKTGKAEYLNPAGMDKAAGGYARETAYSPKLDAVLLGAAKKFDKTRWLLYDCGKNAWMGLSVEGGGYNRPGFFNLGLMYDARRDLFWTMDAYSRVCAMRVDPKTADLKPLAELKLAPAPKKR